MTFKRVGADAVMRATVDGKCQRCTYLLAQCERVIITKKEGKIGVIAECDGYKREPLTVVEMREWRQTRTDPLPASREQLETTLLKLFWTK